MIELLIDAATSAILDVASTISLPGYRVLLLQLVGTRIDDVEAAGQALFASYRGPLARPTLAALANAVANAHDLAPAAPPRLRDGHAAAST
jgi:hypothetical protein